MNYDSNSIQTLDFKEAVRKRIEMYMGSADNQGVIQCVREVISNSIDEYAIGFGNQIDIRVGVNSFSCRDRARGLPFGLRNDGTEAMVAIFTTPHTGGKFNDKMYGNAMIGANGIGLKGVALSSKKFIAKSYRDKQCAVFVMEEGEVKDYHVEPTKEPNGTYIYFEPSQIVYRLEPVKIDVDAVLEMCENWSYLNKNLKINITDEDTEEQITYCSKNGIVDFIKNKAEKTALQDEPYVYNLEDDEGNKLEIAFLWGSKKEHAYVFTNGLQNINGGTSLTGAKTAITRTMKNLLGKELNGDFIRNNLFYVINAKVPHASFSDQTKQKVNNPALRPLADKAFSEALKKFAVEHKSEFEKLTAFLNKIAKADAAAEKARDAILNHEKEMKAQRGRPLISDKLNDAKTLGENSLLLVVEGESSGGNMVRGRQASKMNNIGILKLRGKCINPYTHSVEEVLKNEEVKLLCQALGIVYGEPLNPKKLRYGKIGICVDADDDGSHISLLILALVDFLCPEYIKQNRMCWLRSPLFKVGEGKNAEYFYSYKEFTENTHGSGQIIRVKGLGQLEAEDLIATMFNKEKRRLDTINYTDEGIRELRELMGNDVAPRKDFIFNRIDFGGIKIG